MTLRHTAFAVAALAAATLATPAHAQLNLTPAGVALGFSLSNFLSGGSNYTWLGAANLPDGTLAIGGFANGAIYKFNDVDNQTQANALAAVSFSGQIDMTTAGGQAYAASRSQGFFRVDNNLTLTHINAVPSVLPTQGMAGNPVTGNIIAMTTGGMVNLNPNTGANTFIVNPPSLADGVSVSPDGTIAYTAIFGGAAVRGYNIATGQQVFAATNLPGGPDGTAVIVGGAHNGDIVVNNNDGSVGLIDDVTGLETIIALGGTRGDFASPDHNNGSLLLFEDNAVWRLTVSDGGIGTTPTPEPASLALFAAALVGLGAARRRSS